MDEAQAIDRLKHHDISGLEPLVDIYQDRAVRIAALITRDRATAEDVVSESFLIVYRKIHQFDSSRPFRPWFFRIVTNAALKTIRKGGRELAYEDLVEAQRHFNGRFLVDPTCQDPEGSVEIEELRAAIEAAIRSLSPRLRAAVVLRYYSGLSEAETAEALKIPAGTVKSRISSGLQQLRQLLAPGEPRTEEARDD